MEPRLVQLWSLKPYTCNPELPFRTRGRITRVFREEHSESIRLVLIEPWPDSPRTEQAVVALVFAGRWREACAALCQWDVLEVRNALVVSTAEVAEVRDVGLLQSCIELYDYAMVLEDQVEGRGENHVILPSAATPCVQVLQDAADSGRTSQLQKPRQKPLSSCPAVSIENLEQKIWAEATSEALAPSLGGPGDPAVETRRVPITPAIADSKHRYITLGQLQSMSQTAGQSCDVYGVVADIRAPRQVRTGELLTEVQIIDPSVVLVDERGNFLNLKPLKFMLTSFTSRVGDCIPYIGVGDVIRIHRAELRWYPLQGASGARAETLELKANSLSSLCLWPALPSREEERRPWGITLSTKSNERSPQISEPPQNAIFQDPPEPAIRVYPPNTKSIVITDGEKRYALEMLSWARQILSQSGFLGSKAFSATLSEILREAETEQTTGNVRARARYDLVAVVVGIERTAWEIQLQIVDGSTTNPVSIYIGADCWLRMTHRLEPHVHGNWFRFRDVRLERRQGMSWRLKMTEGSSIYRFPSWMPEVRERILLIADQSGTREASMFPASAGKSMSNEERILNFPVDPVEHRLDKAKASIATSHSPDAAITSVAPGASTATARRPELPRHHLAAHSSWLHCSGPPVLQAATNASISFEALHPQTIADASQLMHAVLDEKLETNARTPYLFRVYARVLDARWIYQADANAALCLMLTDVVAALTHVSSICSEHSSESQLTTNRPVPRKRTSVPSTLPAWVLGEDLNHLLGAIEHINNAGNASTVEKALETVRSVLTMPFAWIDVPLIAYYDVPCEMTDSDYETLNSVTDRRLWYQIIQPELAHPMFSTDASDTE
jgi:hypothetical protein